MRPRRYLKILAPVLFFSLTACAQRTEVRQIHKEVRSLNAEMTRLSEQSVALTQQNTLNSTSTSGAWLLPGADGPARLTTQLGTLTITLDGLQSAEGTPKGVLHILGGSTGPLPAFTANLVWGTLQGTLETPQEVNTHSQVISFPAGTAVPTVLDHRLSLPGFPIGKGGFIRIHNIQPRLPAASH